MKVDTETGEILTDKQLIKVQYFRDDVNVNSREYTYFSEEPLSIGDVVLVPVRDNESTKAQVSAVDVSENEIAKFRDKVKTIPAGAKIMNQEPKQSTLFDGPEVELEIVDEESRDQFLEDFPRQESPEIGQALIKVPPLTQDVDIVRLSDEAIKIKMYAQNMVVSDIAGDKQATNDLTLIAGYKKEIEAKQKEWIAPIKAHEKDIKEAFALLLGPLSVADETLRGKILSFRQEHRENVRQGKKQRGYKKRLIEQR